jgi:predicted DNA-binding protein (MmcQ/YjbR family)
MDLEGVRKICLGFPHTTENIQWGADLCFKIGGKMFCVCNTEPVGEQPRMSFKTTPEGFAELCERDGVIPAPYMARNKWVSLMGWNTLPAAELKERLRESYDLVLGKLPKKTQAELSGQSVGGRSQATSRKPSREPSRKSQAASRKSQATSRKPGRKPSRKLQATSRKPG